MNTTTRHLFAVPLLCVSCGLALAATYALLKPRIEAEQRKNSETVYFEALQLPRGTALLEPVRTTADAALLGLRTPQRIYIAHRDNRIVGIVLPLIAREGYAGDIHLLLGVDVGGKVISARAMSHHETRDLGDKIESGKSDWLEQFENSVFDESQKQKWQLRRDGGAFDGITGATVTSRAVVKAVQQGLEYFATYRDELLEQHRHE